MTTLPEEIKYCLESSFIIDLLRGKEDAVRVYEEIKNVPLTIAAVASVTLFEILRGEEQKPEKIAKFEELRAKLTVLPFGEREAEEASDIEKAMHAKGAPIEKHSLDLLIGATAKTNGAILIYKDPFYERIDGLKLYKY